MPIHIPRVTNPRCPARTLRQLYASTCGRIGKLSHQWSLEILRHSKIGRLVPLRFATHFIRTIILFIKTHQYITLVDTQLVVSQLSSRCRLYGAQQLKNELTLKRKIHL